ncbi:MAG: sulfatase-like hydrolase/transferase [Planctomycetota bacterium]
MYEKFYEADKPPVQAKGWQSALLPYGLAIGCCLAILVGRPTDLPPVEMIGLTIGQVLIGVAALHLVLFILVRKSPKRELILSAFVGFILLYGHFCNYAGPRIGTGVCLYAWIGIGISSLLFMFRLGDAPLFHKLVPVMLFALVATVGFQLYGIGRPLLKDMGAAEQLVAEVKQSDPLAGVEVSANQSAAMPDIYYIIVDAYARHDVLQSMYKFDNSEFLNQLRSRGFFIGDQSRSNYHLTETSVASSLNMTHLGELGLDDFETRIPVRSLIKDSAAVRFLKSAGYSTACIESGKSDTSCEDFDWYYESPFALNEYQDVLYHGSVLPELLPGDYVRSAARLHGDRVLNSLEMIPMIVDEKDKPTFVFSHMLSPHPPFVFDAEGNEVEHYGYYLIADADSFTTPNGGDVELYRNSYVEQLKYMNGRLLTMIDAIRAKNREAIIIIQGDHGPRMGFADVEGEGADPNARYREGFSILNAISVPPRFRPQLYSSITPVNTFRVIFNEVFRTNLPVIGDNSFFEDQYAFRDATPEALPVVPGRNPVSHTNSPQGR